MPELPEVETIRIALASALEGKTITHAKTFRPDLRFPLPTNFAQKLHQRRITRVTRWSKYLLLGLDNHQWWLIHLGMSGQCLIVDPDTTQPTKHDHVLVNFDDDLQLLYRDPRRFGMMDLLTDPATHPPLKRLGREAILTPGTHPDARRKKALDSDYLAQIFAKRHQAIKQTLFDQRLIAGLGNIYINEILWRAGIHPETPGHAIPTQLIPPLLEATVSTLHEALAAGGSSLKDFRQTNGQSGYFQHQWNVYGHDGEKCAMIPCKGIIEKDTLHGRATYFCPVHQTLF